MIDVTSKVEGNALVVRFNNPTLGVHDVLGVELLNKKILDSKKRGCEEIVFDLHSVEDMDSAGISYLVRCHLDAFRSGKKLYLKNICRKILDVLERTSLIRDFNVVR